MKFTPAKNFSRADRTKIDLVVIHTAECGETSSAAENVAAYFGGANAPQASAHYTVDNDSIVQSVFEKDIAWHAGPVNGFSIGVEHAGFAKQESADWADEYSKALLARSAELVGDICKRYGIPVRRLTADDLARGERRGICGHVDVTKGLQGGKGHWDPGPNFPWDAYLELVAQHAGEPVEAPKPPPILPPITLERFDNEGDAGPDFSSFVEVELDGVTWLVAPIYVAPVAIGQARDLAAKLGCELPSPALVDAIWKAADLKIDGALMTRSHNGTPAEMDSPEVHADQARRLAQRVEKNLGSDFKLLAGAFKDVVVKDGHVGLYGWHRANGTVIQPFYGGHALTWRDYSQGLRLVKRKT